MDYPVEPDNDNEMDHPIKSDNDIKNISQIITEKPIYVQILRIMKTFLATKINKDQVQIQTKITLV